MILDLGEFVGVTIPFLERHGVDSVLRWLKTERKIVVLHPPPSSLARVSVLAAVVVVAAAVVAVVEFPVAAGSDGIGFGMGSVVVFAGAVAGAGF